MSNENEQNKNVIVIHQLIGRVPSFLIAGPSSPLGEFLAAAEEAKQKAEASAKAELESVKPETPSEDLDFGDLFIDDLMPELSLSKRPNLKATRVKGIKKD